MTGQFSSYPVSTRPHQSQLTPAENKFHKGNGQDLKHYWLTPAWLWALLKAEFGSNLYDPCPFPRPVDYDGLAAEWGAVSYVNPPFGSVLRFASDDCKHEIATPKSRTCIHCGPVGKKQGPTAWIRKAIAESLKGKTVILVFPVDKWLLMLVKAIFGEEAEIRNLGDVRWLATEDGTTGKGTGRHIAMFILRARRNYAPPRAMTDAEFMTADPL